VPNAGQHAVVAALYVHAIDAIEIIFAGVFQLSNVRNPGVVDENVNPFFRDNASKYFLDLTLIRNIALIGKRESTGFRNFGGSCCGLVEVDVDQMNPRAALGESFCDGTADPASAASNNGRFAI
jgi:hypothetical protein